MVQKWCKMVFNPFLHFQACFGLHVFLGCVIELSVEMANFLIDVFESPEDFEVILARALSHIVAKTMN